MTTSPILNSQTTEQPAVKRQFYKRDPATSLILIILVFFLSQIVAGVIISIYPTLKNWPSDQANSWINDSVIARFAYIALAETFAIWLVFGLLRRIRVAKKDIGVRWPHIRDVGYALSGYVVYFICYLVIITIASHYTKLNVDQPQKIGFESAKSTQLYLVFASLVILPPIAEEIMFRGFLFTSLRRKFRLRYAIIITSVLFGIAHLQFDSGAPLLWTAAIDTFMLSCVLCYLREKTGSLWASILLHALKNCIAFTVLFRGRF